MRALAVLRPHQPLLTGEAGLGGMLVIGETVRGFHFVHYTKLRMCMNRGLNESASSTVLKTKNYQMLYVFSKDLQDESRTTPSTQMHLIVVWMLQQIKIFFCSHGIANADLKFLLFVMVCFLPSWPFGFTHVGIHCWNRNIGVERRIAWDWKITKVPVCGRSIWQFWAIRSPSFMVCGKLKGNQALRSNFLICGDMFGCVLQSSESSLLYCASTGAKRVTSGLLDQSMGMPAILYLCES